MPLRHDAERVIAGHGKVGGLPVKCIGGLRVSETVACESHVHRGVFSEVRLREVRDAFRTRIVGDEPVRWNRRGAKDEDENFFPIPYAFCR